ncbi:MAG TPA: R3H domain-containing nucleic acid-binding protein [Candidatus Limnocylindrales bacterium]|nr:R3H domain-containing nucleic acid-binding protein [Candidatus Limnocylindrales bacterium]
MISQTRRVANGLARADPAELDLLFQALPPHINRAVRRLDNQGLLLEVVLDLGREPEARFPDSEVLLDETPVTAEDLEFVATRVGSFGDDNRAGIERTLHRISAIRNRSGQIIGLTCRVGRAITGTIDIIKDMVVGGKSILLLGRPGIGKTTMLRECARVLAEEMKKRVVIVDTSNEIGGDGDIPHPGIGRARRMQVRTPALQHAVMIEAVENHMPQVIVIDEIGTELEAAAARTIAERGVQLVATAHGNSLENLMINPTLNDLLGGIQTVTLSDEEARRRGTQKSVLERKSPPTFDVLVEIHDRDRLAVHQPLAEVVDAALRGVLKPPQMRTRGADGAIVARIAEAQPMRATAPREPLEGSRTRGVHESLNIFPYGVSRNYLEQAIQDLKVPVRVQNHIEDADLIVTLKNYYRRKDSPIKEAEADGIPIQVLKSNTITQIKSALTRMYQLEAPDPTESALQETIEGINRAKATNSMVELSPQNAYVRRLQHQLVERHELTARSTGKQPNRRLRIYTTAD